MGSFQDFDFDDEADLLGVTTEADRIQEANEAAIEATLERAAAKAAADLAAGKPAVKKAPAKKGSNASGIRAALDTLEPGALETSSERRVREVEKLKLEAQPITRPSGLVYHPRELAGKVDVKVLQEFRQAGIPILLSGYPGCGKTSLVEAAYASEGGAVTFAGHGEAEIGELMGRYVARPGGKYEWVDGPLIVAMKEGRPLFLDDATLVPSGVLARLYPVMDGRNAINLDEHEGEEVKALPGFYVLAAHNPGVPGAVLSEALSSRFALQLDVPTDLDLAIELGVDRFVVGIARKMQDDRAATNNGAWAPEMRELLAYKKISALLGQEAALRNLISICPEYDRPTLVKLLTKKVDNAQPLSLAGRI